MNSRDQSNYGLCHICGKEDKLTFEHVPPKSTFNKTTKYVATNFQDFMTSENPLKNKPKGKIEQGGMGFYSLCEKCNNFLGVNYVKAYEKWVRAGYEMLIDKNPEPLAYKVLYQEPLKVIKQVASMFLSLNALWYLEEYPEISNFILNPESQSLPDKYRIFTYLTDGGNSRYLQHMVSYSPSIGSVNVTEIAFPPFGFVMTFNFDGDLPNLTEITNFKNYPLNANPELYFSMAKLPTYLPIPLDYRPINEIEDSIAKGIIEKQKFRDEFGFE
jgi:hypothetical protein